MAGKMSNRDRIAQKAAEAAATEREKTSTKAKKAADRPAKTGAKPKSSGKSGSKPVGKSFGRIKIIWLVCGPSGGEVKQYPYAQEAEARAEAEQLSVSTGKSHFVRRAEVPLST